MSCVEMRRDVRGGGVVCLVAEGRGRRRNRGGEGRWSGNYY